MEIEEFINKIICDDCIEELKKIPEKSIDLIFADPPYNIGIDYDTYKDNKSYSEYVFWSEKWIDGCLRVLKENGSIYIAIRDDYAAEIVMMMKRKGMHLRNWIIWYYTFGQSMKKKFSLSHTHILYFVKNPKNFTFNADAIRVTSVRQIIGDKRAYPKGKLPDDVWQFNTNSYEDVWKISRVAGTFNERIKGFPCQMPEKLLDRVIEVSSNKNDVVLDPFVGSGTTCFVAKKLGRKYIGIDISPNYCKITENRLKSILG